jgi:hypothetical protein
VQHYYPSANVLMRDFACTQDQATLIRRVMQGKVCAFDPDLFPKTHHTISSLNPFPPYHVIQMMAIGEVLKLPVAESFGSLFLNRKCIGKLTITHQKGRFKIDSQLNLDRNHA